jgi:hypothetical protein
VLAFVAAFALGKYAARAAMSLSLGLALFVALGVIYMLVGAVRGPVEPGRGIGVSAILAATFWNPIFYLAFIMRKQSRQFLNRLQSEDKLAFE